MRYDFGVRGVMALVLLAAAACGGPRAAHRSGPPAQPHASVAALVDRGHAAFAAGDWVAAGEAYDGALARSPGPLPAVVYARRALVHRELGDIDGARDFLRTHWSPLGWRHWRILDARVALIDADAARGEAPAIAHRAFALDRRAHWSAYLLCLASGGVGDACDAYFEHRPERLAVRDRRVLLYRAFTVLERGRYRDAGERFRELAEHHPDDRSVQVNTASGLCAVEVMLGRYRDAIGMCLRAIELGAARQGADRRGAVHYNLSRAYHAVGQLEQARLHAELYSEQVRNRDKVAALLRRLGGTFIERNFLARPATALDSGRAQARLEAGDLAGALELAEDHIARFPWDSEGYRFLARVRLAERRWISALLAWLVAHDPGVRRGSTARR